MRLLKLNLSNIRNIKKSEFLFSGKNTQLVGKNGSGKSTIIETIFFLSCGKSFRSSNFKELIQYETDNASIEAEIENDEGEKYLISILLNSIGNKEIKIFGKKIKKNSELLYLFPLLLLNQNTIHLIQGSPMERRAFLDSAISKRNINYFEDITIASKLIKQKKELLRKQNFSKQDQLLNHYDNQIEEIYNKIKEIRRTYLKELEDVLNKLIINVPKQSLFYKSSILIEYCFQK